MNSSQMLFTGYFMAIIGLILGSFFHAIFFGYLAGGIFLLSLEYYERWRYGHHR